jgi:putative membrane protein
MMVLFWGLVLVGVVALVWLTLGRGRERLGVRGSGPEESALDLLKKRYARGEISREEYERMKRELE